MSRRLLRRGAALGLALAVTGCAGTAPSRGAGSSPAPASRLIQVAYASGAVEGGGGRIPVGVGETITLEVISDVADEVHVHGYDLMADVTPGSPAMLTFEAAIPGVFEVELEDLGQELLTLQVQ